MSVLEAPVIDWDRLSGGYERQRWLERSSVRTLVELSAPAGSDRVIDLGTGTGAVLRALAARPDRPRAVLGLDRSAGMLARVPTLPAGWQVLRADVRHLPVDDASADLITAGYLLHLLEESDRAATLAEARRVLRPGGRLGVLTPYIPARQPLKTLGAWLDRLAQLSPQTFGGLRALDPRPELEAAGFTVTAIRVSIRGYLSLAVLARREARA